MRWAAALVLLLPVACTGVPANLPFTPPTYFAYRCETGPGFEVRLAEGGALVLWDSRRAVLRQVPAASGARYADGAGRILHLKGLEAAFETPDLSWRACRGQLADTPWRAAAVRGIDLRAIGNEPPWLLEVDFQREMRIVLDNGDTVLTGPPPDDDEGTISLPISGHDARLTIVDDPCRDTMSGEVVERTVTLTLDGTIYRGCGKEMADPFAG